MASRAEDGDDVRPDYARGQQQDRETGAGGSDFARGQRTNEMNQHEGTFAEGQDDGSEHHPENTSHGDFAQGQRQEKPDRN